MSRDLGRLGEVALTKLCHEVGLKCNKSEIDHTGWDYVVELPFDNGCNLDSENDFSKTMYRFQVKSSDKKFTKHKVTLSNLKRFVNDPAPAFFIFFEYDGTNQPVRCYLRHVEKEIISLTIQRLREKDILNDRALYKKYIPISYEASDEMTPITGEELRSRIISYVGLDSFEYATKKRKLVKEVGYEGNSITISFKKDDNEIEEIIDTSIGLRESFPVKELVVYETRFNLDKIIKQEFNAEIKFSPVPAKEKISLICNDGRGVEVARIDALMYIPSIISEISDNLKKIRFKSSHLEILINLGSKKTNVKFNIHEDEKVDLFKSRQEVNFFFACLEHEKIGIEREDGVVHYLEFKDYQNSEMVQLKKMRDLINRSCSILYKNNISACNTTLKKIHDQELIITLYSQAIEPMPGMLISSKLIKKTQLNSNLSKVAMVFTYQIDFGEWFLAISVAFSGNNNLIHDNDESTFIIEKPLSVDHFIKKKRNSISFDELIMLENQIKKIILEKEMDAILSQRHVTS